MRHTPALILAAALLAACASTKTPPAAEPKAAPPAPAAVPPPAHQDETPPTPPKAKKTLQMKIPGGWARIPPSMIGAPDDIDAVLLNPPKKGMILVDIYGTRGKSASEEAEETRNVLLQNKGMKVGKVEKSADGNLAWFTWSNPAAGQGKPERGKVAIKHIPKTDDTPDVTIEMLGMWDKSNDKDNAKDLDEALASFIFQ